MTAYPPARTRPRTVYEMKELIGGSAALLEVRHRLADAGQGGPVAEMLRDRHDVLRVAVEDPVVRLPRLDLEAAVRGVDHGEAVTRLVARRVGRCLQAAGIPLGGLGHGVVDALAADRRALLERLGEEQPGREGVEPQTGVALAVGLELLKQLLILG